MIAFLRRACRMEHRSVFAIVIVQGQIMTSIHTNKISERQASLSVLTAAAFWGAIGLFTRSLSAAGMTPLGIAFFRSLTAALLLALILAVTDKGAFRIVPKDIRIFMGTGIISIGCFNVFYFYTQTVTTLSISAVLLYTAPFFVIIMSAVFFKERVTGRKIAALALAFCGCLFVTGVIGGGGSLRPLALATGLASAVCYALYTIIGRVALEKYPPLTVTFYSLSFSALAMGMGCLVHGDQFLPLTTGVDAVILGFGLTTVIAYICYTRGLEVLEAGKASTLAFAEPMVATILGFVVLGEPVTLFSAAGIGLIFTAIVILNRRPAAENHHP